MVCRDCNVFWRWKPPLSPSLCILVYRKKRSAFQMLLFSNHYYLFLSQVSITENPALRSCYWQPSLLCQPHIRSRASSTTTGLPQSSLMGKVLIFMTFWPSPLEFPDPFKHLYYSTSAMNRARPLILSYQQPVHLHIYLFNTRLSWWSLLNLSVYILAPPCPQSFKDPESSYLFTE